ncbi:MAG TPA: BatD family protein, partial [Lentisphaeria bacterium]|nr:BatD family protein [Lentisphaeria bacterium]
MIKSVPFDWVRSFSVFAMPHFCRHSRFALLLWLTAPAFLLPLALAIAESEVKIGIESQNVYLGETFVFQISVSGDNEPEQPVFPKTTDFQVESLGPRRNRSTSVSITNGRMVKTSVNETVFTYRLTATRTGTLNIPSISVKADGRVFHTQAVPIHVMAPEKMDDMALEVAVSSPECYVGQPVMVTWKWFIGRRVLDYRLNLPLLAEKNFSFPAYTPDPDPARRRNYQRIALSSGDELIGILEQATRNGVPVSCLTFSLPMIPMQAGTYTFPVSTVTFTIEDQSRARRSRRQSPFDGFGFFDQTPTRTMTIATPALS